MTRCKSTTKEVNLLARIMKAEALGEGKTGMLLVGNVAVNRVVAKCDVFRRTNSLTKVIYQKNAFSGLNTRLFNSGANSTQRNLAKRTIKSWRGHPATRALFFNNPGRKKACKKTFYGPLIGKYKSHCFYRIKNQSKCGL